MSAEVYVSSCPSSSTLEAYAAEFVLEYFEYSVPQTLKARCRDIARAESGLLVAPAPESQYAKFGKRASFKPTIWIVAKTGVLSSSAKVKEKLRQHDFRLKQAMKVNQTILQTCYTFTVVARLAPKWNMVTRWLVQGSDFYMTAKASALDFEASFTASDITLTLNVQRLTFNHLTIEDLGLTPIITNKFKKNPNYVINSNHISTNRCVVLPNLSTAYVHSASHHMPSSYELPNYDKLRLHWKKQHGIMLPEAQTLFYEVFFAHKSKKLFSYPACCVLRDTPLVYPERDPHLVTAAFISDLHSRVPTICGDKVIFSAKPFHTTSDLNPASSSTLNDASCNSHTNLSLAPPSEKPNPHRPMVNNRGTIGIRPPAPFENSKENSIQGSTSTNESFISRSVIVPPAAKRVCLGEIDLSVTNSTVGTHNKGEILNAALVHQPVLQTLPQPVQHLPTPGIDPQDPPGTPVGTMGTGMSGDTPMGGASEQPRSEMDNLQSQSLLNAVPTTSVHITNVPDHLIKKIGMRKNAELKEWLKGKGVKHSGRMKKEELVKLITQHISTTGCDYP